MTPCIEHVFTINLNLLICWSCSNPLAVHNMFDIPCSLTKVIHPRGVLNWSETQRHLLSASRIPDTWKEPQGDSRADTSLSTVNLNVNVYHGAFIFLSWNIIDSVSRIMIQRPPSKRWNKVLPIVEFELFASGGSDFPDSTFVFLVWWINPSLCWLISRHFMFLWKPSEHPSRGLLMP